MLNRLKKWWLIYFATTNKTEARLHLLIGKRVRVKYKPAGWLKGVLTDVGMTYMTYYGKTVFTILIDGLPLSGFKDISTIEVE